LVGDSSFSAVEHTKLKLLLLVGNSLILSILLLLHHLLKQLGEILFSLLVLDLEAPAEACRPHMPVLFC